MNKLEVERTLSLTVQNVIDALRAAGYDVPHDAGLLAFDPTRYGSDRLFFRWRREESVTREKGVESAS